MLHSILNLEGVTKLNKEQQQRIKGQYWGVECVVDADCNNPEQVCERWRCLYFI